MKDFKEFLLRGNLVDTAVGIVIGLVFAAVITALVADLITPLTPRSAGIPTSRASRSRSTAASSSTGRSSTR
jgi:large conductance mechanosensitive channel protein